MGLSRPLVVGPVSELTQSVRLQGQLSGATVSIVSVGPSAREVANGVASSSDERFPLLAGEALKEDDVLLAKQTLGGESSVDPVAGLSLGVTVQRAPATVGDLTGVTFVSALYECGRHVWIKGGIPGAEGRVSVSGVAVATGDFNEAEGARLEVPPLEIQATAAQQVVVGVGDGPATSRVPHALPGGPGDALRQPRVDPIPVECDGAVRVKDIFDGAEVVISRNDGKSVVESRAGFDASALWFPVDPYLTQSDQLELHQEVGPQCERKWKVLKVAVGPPGPNLPPTIDPVCPGAPLIKIGALAPNAEVELSIGGTTLRTQAARDSTTLAIPVDDWPAGQVSVRQRRCGAWSPPATATHFVAVGGPSVEIVDPLYSCSPIVVVKGPPGPFVVRVSSKRNGPLSGYVYSAGGVCVVDVAPLLTSPDDITAELWQCGAAAVTQTKPVTPHPDARAPKVGSPIYINDTTIRIDGLQVGATVSIEVSDSSGGIRETITQPAADVGATIDLSQPLESGDTVVARQGFCDELGAPSQAVSATLVPVTQDWWQWDGQSPMAAEWNRDYDVGGALTNKGTTGLVNVQYAYWEDSTDTGDHVVGPLNAGQSAPGTFNNLKKDWSWLTPGIWNPHGPFAKTFKCTVVVTADDGSGNPYPPMTTSPFVVVVQVSAAKRLAASQAAGQAAAAIALGIAAAAAALGIFTAGAAVALGIAAGVAAGASAAAGAIALDPPEPDPEYRSRITPLVPDVNIPELPSLARFLHGQLAVPTIEATKSLIEGRLLGAIAADDAEWIAIHRGDLTEAGVLQQSLATEAAAAMAPALAELASVIEGLAALEPGTLAALAKPQAWEGIVETAGVPQSQIDQLQTLFEVSPDSVPDLAESFESSTTSLVGFAATLGS